MTAIVHRGITVDPRAAETVRAMHQQAQAIEQSWKDQPEHAVKAYGTLTRALAQIMDQGDAQVFRDGDLSLVYTSFITVGVVFFPTHRPGGRHVKMAVEGDIDLSRGAVRTGRYCMTGLTEGYCMSPYVDNGTAEGAPTCEGHMPLPATMPIPGEWSMHS